MHAHIILWVDEIVVVVLAIFDETTKNFIPPSDSLQNKFYKLVKNCEIFDTLPTNARKKCIFNNNNLNCCFKKFVKICLYYAYSI